MPDLTAVGVTAGYDGPPVLDKVGVKCEAGTTTVVLGPNGAGKSTLAKAIVGLLTIREGSVTLLGQDITGMGPHKLVRRGLAYLPQLMNIFDQMTVIENLEMGAQFPRAKKVRKETNGWVLQLFPRLQERKSQLAGTLSGGEQQALAIARALMSGPKLLLMDEPSLGLSPKVMADVFSMILGIKEQGISVLMVEQNARQALAVADWAYVLEAGKAVADGSPADLEDDVVVRKTYLGH